jgi:AraC family transcriptional regulator of adaptative response / DNA-3-methyladenine glycosylase II
VPAVFTLTDLKDTGAAVERARRLLDADCDPVAVDDAWVDDPWLGPLAERRPGLRVPGHVDGNELAVRAVLGQQITVAGARTLAARLTEELGEPVVTEIPGLSRAFPSPDRVADLDPATLPMPRARGHALVGLCAALADGGVSLDRGPDRDDVRRQLLALPGIGPWTADYVALRALAHPDVFLPTDLGTRAALAALGADPARAADLAEQWRPWRSYAQLHLWHSLDRVAEPSPEVEPDETKPTEET